MLLKKKKNYKKEIENLILFNMKEELYKMSIDKIPGDSKEGYEGFMRFAKMLEAMPLEHRNNMQLDPNVLLGIAGNLAGILLILNYEKLGIITSKAVQFVLKNRIV